MPLVATLAGKRVVSIDLSHDEWDSLKKRYRAGEPPLVSCGQPGSARVSSRGLKFFAHKKRADCDMHEGGETAEHLELKSLLVKAAKAAGWEAELEVPSPQRDWIADVMATKGERRSAGSPWRCNGRAKATRTSFAARNATRRTGSNASGSWRRRTPTTQGPFPPTPSGEPPAHGTFPRVRRWTATAGPSYPSRTQSCTSSEGTTASTVNPTSRRIPWTLP